MEKIFLKYPTGFKAKDKFLILDENKKEFYSSNFTNTLKNTGTLKFNLPRGIFYIIGDVEKLLLPVNYKLPDLPPKQRNWKAKKGFTVYFRKNPNKCSVNHLTKEIIFDPVFKDAPKYIFYNIYAHELGHQFYTTEHYADLYATRWMLINGFNPSQIGRSIMFSITQNNNFYRKEKVVSQLEKLKRKRK